MAQSKLQKALMIAVWLIIVCTSLVYAIANIKKHPIWSIAAILIAVAMLAIFLADHVIKKKLPGKDIVGDYAVFVAIFGVLIILSGSFIVAVLKHSWQPAIIMGLFLSVFIRIARDYIKHLKHKAKIIKQPPTSPRF